MSIFLEIIYKIISFFLTGSLVAGFILFVIGSLRAAWKDSKDMFKR